MISDNSLYNELYSTIAEELDISPTMREKAERAYRCVGEWIDEGPEQPAKIYAQGSFALGTVTRPTSGEDADYDIDLVSEMPGLVGQSPSVVKRLVGKRLREHGTYASKLEPEGKRCWTLTFDDFHMDVLPCTPDPSTSSQTSITLTNREPNGTYTTRSSDPLAYKDWFERRMGESLASARRAKVGKVYASVDQVPTYAVSTPLQMALRILKHHRDVMFEGRDDAPISIIITTLAALAYDQSPGVFDTVSTALGSMASFIRREGDLYVIQNPVDPLENFADKWNEDGNKARAFFEWLEAGRYDLVDRPLHSSGLDMIEHALEGPLAKRVVINAFGKFGDRLLTTRNNGALRYSAATGLTLSSSTSTKTVPHHLFYGR